VKLKAAFYVNGAPKVDAVIELEKPDVPEGWRVVGKPLVRRAFLTDGTQVEVRWILSKYAQRRKKP
jgi:hypothetical protein